MQIPKELRALIDRETMLSVQFDGGRAPLDVKDSSRGYYFLRTGSDGVQNETRRFRTKEMLLDAWVADKLIWKYKWD